MYFIIDYIYCICENYYIVVLNNLEQTLTYIIQPCCIQSQLNLERALTGYHIYFATYTKLPNSKYMSFPPKITFLKLSDCSIVQIELFCNVHKIANIMFHSNITSGVHSYVPYIYNKTTNFKITYYIIP